MWAESPGASVYFFCDHIGTPFEEQGHAASTQVFAYRTNSSCGLVHVLVLKIPRFLCDAIVFVSDFSIKMANNLNQNDFDVAAAYTIPAAPSCCR